jgi:hypothetical protein
LAYHGKFQGKQYLPRKVYQARMREAAKGGMELFEGGLDLFWYAFVIPDCQPPQNSEEKPKCFIKEQKYVFY